MIIYFFIVINTRQKQGKLQDFPELIYVILLHNKIKIELIHAKKQKAVRIW